MLNDSDIIKYAQIAADKLAIKIPNIVRVKRRMKIAIPEPFVFSNGANQLWIDKKYIAYSNHDSPRVNYVYLSKLHIKEENKAYEVARRRRNLKVYLPKTIRAEFRMAQYEMRKTGLDHYVNHEFLKIG